MSTHKQRRKAAREAAKGRWREFQASPRIPDMTGEEYRELLIRAAHNYHPELTREEVEAVADEHIVLHGDPTAPNPVRGIWSD